MLSVCIGHKNRAFVQAPGGEFRPLFRASFAALVAALVELGEPAEIVIADFSDDDRLGLGPWIADSCGIPVRVVRGAGPFTFGGGRNQAVAEAGGEQLFFMDADMLTPAAVIRRGLQVLAEGKAFAPFYERLDVGGGVSQKGIGTGNLFCLRNQFREAGPYKETPEWSGDEDSAMWHWWESRGLGVREAIPGFVHQWHPHVDRVI